VEACGREVQGYAKLAEWDVKLCSPREASAFADTAERLCSAFREFGQLKQRLMNEMSQDLGLRYSALLNEIFSLYKNVAGSLSPPVSQAQLPVIATAAVPEPEIIPQQVTEPEKAETQPEIAPKPETETEPPQDEQISCVFPPEEEVICDPPQDEEHSIYTFPAEASSQKIANTILLSEKENPFSFLRDLIWRLVYEDNLAFALKISRFLESTHSTESLWLRPWLITSFALGPHILDSEGDIEGLLHDNFKDFNAEQLFIAEQKEWNQSCRLLMAAAALRAALIAPSTNAPSILLQLQFTGLPRLYEFCQFIGKSAERPQALDTDTLKKVKEYVSWESDLDALKAEVDKWLQNARSYRMDYAPGLRVWQHWVREGLVHKLLSPIKDDLASELSTLEEDI